MAFKIDLKAHSQKFFGGYLHRELAETESPHTLYLFSFLIRRFNTKWKVSLPLIRSVLGLNNGTAIAGEQVNSDKIKVTIDTADGPVEEEVFLEDLSIENLRFLVSSGMKNLIPYLEERVDRDEAGIRRYWPDGTPLFKVRREPPILIFVVHSEKMRLVDALSHVVEGVFSHRRDGEDKILLKNSPLWEEYLFSPKFRTFQADWAIEPIIDADPADAYAWQHQLVKMLDLGLKVSGDEVAKYAFEVDPEEIAEL